MCALPQDLTSRTSLGRPAAELAYLILQVMLTTH